MLVRRLLESREFLLILLALAGSVLFLMFFPFKLDPLLLISILSTVLFLALRNTMRIVSSPVIPYFSFQLLIILFAIDNLLPGSFAPHLLVVAVATLASGFYLLQDFGYFWKSRVFQCFLIFCAINLVFLFCYSSDFNLSAVSAGYPIDFLTETGDMGAKYIVFLSSFVTVLAVIIGLAVFRKLKTPEVIQERLYLLAKVFSVGCISLVVLLALGVFRAVMPGQGTVLALVSFLVLSTLFWLNQSPFAKQETDWIFGMNPQKLILLSMPLAAIALLLSFNKTSLIGYGFSVFFFLLLNQIFVPSINFFATIHRLLKPLEAKLAAILIPTIAFALAWSMGVFNLISSKLDYFVNGFSSMSTMQIRVGNWQYFINDWLYSLKPTNFLFGHGLGQSRESVFFISAMRQNADRTLVQTVHDSYIEYFYDYGLLALIFYAATLIIIISSIRDLLSPKVNQTVKIFSIFSLTCILYIGIYALTDGVRIHVMMVYFAGLAMVEGLRTACKHHSQTLSSIQN
jgi:hypothetical protein